jgi:toxin ParE1/3/4
LKRYTVNIVQDAEQDITDIYTYIALHDAEENAVYVLDELESLCLSLEALPLRGHVPPELERIGVTRYLELHFKPYRIIYEVIQRDVFIHCVLDGRRDMQLLLERRLVR